MFNLSNKSTTITQYTTVKKYSNFVGKIFVGMFLVGMYIVTSINAIWYWGLDTKIQTALESLRPQDAINNLYWGMDMDGSVDIAIFKNMYSKSYRLASVQQEATVIQTIASLKVEIMKTYKCELTDNEAELLFQNEWKTVTANDCLPLIYCREGANNKGKKKIDVSNTELNSCKAFVKTKYEKAYKAIYDSSTLMNTTLGTDIYANGTLDDAWYDILYDIQKIGDILFTENDQTEKTLFFSFPDGSIAWLQAIQFGENTTNNGLPKSTTLVNGKKESLWWENPDDNWTDWSTENGESRWAEEEGNTATQDPSMVGSENSDISNFACIPEKKEDSTDPNIDKTTDDQWKKENEKNNKTTQTRRPPGETVNINQRGTDRPTQNDSSTVSNADRDQSTSMADNEEEVKACIKKCTEGKWSFSDRVFCIAKCSCTTKRTDDWMAWISICMVPWKQTDVLSRKPIQSVQEVINEINNILTALRDSWELIKHNKPTEFLDISLAKIELHKIFAFDVNVTMKPIFTVNPKKKDTAKNETESDKMANGNYPDIDIGKEKNKYAFYRNNGLTGSKISVTESENQEIKALNTIQESQSQALIKTQNAQIIEWVRSFVLDNIVYWDSVAEIVSSIQKTSDQIKQKIINK